MPSALLLRFFSLVAMAVSAALFMHYVNPVEGAFCGASSGCEEVRQSGIGYFFHPALNLPLIGLVAYGVVLAASVQGKDPRLAPKLALAGALGGVVLLGLQQFYIQAFCWLCTIVDVAAILAGVFGWLELKADAPPSEPLRKGAWAGLATIAVVGAPLFTAVRPAPDVPAPVRALYEPGKINVVEFADFQCPYCRRLHPIVKAALAAYPPERVNFRRMNVPLPHHEYAMPMAMTFVCAEQQGKGPEAADLLVELDPSDDAPIEVIKRLRLDVGRFEACIDDPKTEARIESETAVLKEAGMLGLPTTYIEGKRFVGLVDIVAVRDALSRADRGETSGGIPGAAYWGIVLLAVGLVIALGRARPKETPNPS